MALVAYDNSDSSEFEDEDDQATAVILNKKVEEPTPSVSNLMAEDNGSSSSTSLFNLLPQPTIKKPAVEEEEDEFLHKKEEANIVKPKAKIMVPSLSDFKDVEDKPTNKPRMASCKKSGLLSMLPEPKNAVTKSTKSLIPHVLTQKPATVKKKQPLPSPMKKTKETKPLVNSYSDESDNDDEVQNDFFSFNKKEEPLPEVPLEIAPPVETATPRNIESYFNKEEAQNHLELQPDYVEASGSMEYSESSSYNGSNVPESSNISGDVLDEEAILKLCGSRGKRKREEIQIVDVNQQEVLADAREWLVKGLMDDTSKRVSASKRKGNEPTSQQKRKHQITYLAHQAKANEAELQNQWANSRVSRRQTQSKYGF